MPYRPRPNQLRSQAARPAPIASLSEPIPRGLAELRDAPHRRRERLAVDPRYMTAGSPALPCATDRAQAHPELRPGAPFPDHRGARVRRRYLTNGAAA